MTDHRASLSYCICGLAAREQLVFKSLMRLLEPRLQHVWNYQPVAELLVTAGPSDDVSYASLLKGIDTSIVKAKLVVGSCVGDDIGNLSLPIRANNLEERINALGKTIVQTRLQRTGEAPVIGLSTALPIKPALDVHGSFKLKRWPPSRLFNVSGRAQIATVLLRQAITIDKILKLSGQEPPICMAFLNELWQADLLDHQSAPLPVATSAPENALPAPPSGGQAPESSLGLLARIRKRIGL